MTTQRSPAAESALEVLLRYRHEVPLGHQPHMLAHAADEVIATLRAELAADKPLEVVTPVTDDEACAACITAGFFITSESKKDMRRVLEGFFAQRAST